MGLRLHQAEGGQGSTRVGKALREMGVSWAKRTQAPNPYADFPNPRTRNVTVFADKAFTQRTVLQDTTGSVPDPKLLVS